MALDVGVGGIGVVVKVAVAGIGVVVGSIGV